MYARNYWFLAFCFLLLTAGCIDDELQQNQNDDVVADLAFAVTRASKPSTRMTSAVVQGKDQPYRGIKMRQIVPFAVTGKITVNDLPKRFFIVSDGEKPVNDRPYYYYNDCSIMRGVNAFLSYGRATQASTDKHINGCLVETFPAGMEPKDIRFSLESISQRTENTIAISLAEYMTSIANAEANAIAWKQTTNTTLELMYKNFINQIGTSSNGEILPGSAANIYAFVKALKHDLQALSLSETNDKDLRDAIISKINTYNSSWDNFPASIGLPDGAVVIRWVEANQEFEPQLAYTSFADINGIDRFAYPAELYYYGNSLINTSSLDNRKASYTDQEWSAVLATYEHAPGVVTSSTKAVAVIDPLQYGVAHLQVKLIKTDESLKDANNQDVAVGTENFPLTGIIVGGQLPVGFDFSPTTTYSVYSEGDMKFIYDNQLPTLYLSSSADATEVTNTLVLQTYDHKKVPVLLEFINNSDVDFKGQDGIVYQGTKFYLAGEVDPADGTGGDTSAVGRVFTQDHTTTLNMKVTSLAKAYNVVPNLLAPRLELGIQLVLWTSTTPEEIVL